MQNSSKSEKNDAPRKPMPGFNTLNKSWWRIVPIIKLPLRPESRWLHFSDYFSYKIQYGYSAFGSDQPFKKILAQARYLNMSPYNAEEPQRLTSLSTKVFHTHQNNNEASKKKIAREFVQVPRNFVILWSVEAAGHYFQASRSEEPRGSHKNLDKWQVTCLRLSPVRYWYFSY